MPRLTIPKMPSAEDFMKKVPDEDFFKKQIEDNIPDISSQAPTTEEFIADAKSKYSLPDVDGVTSMLDGSNGIIDFATKTNDLINGGIDVPVITDMTNKIDEFKDTAKMKAIEEARKLANKFGINIPEIPTEEELLDAAINMKEEDIVNIQNKMNEVRSFASKYGFDIPNIPDDGVIEKVKNIVNAMNNLKSENDISGIIGEDSGSLNMETISNNITNMMDKYGIQIDDDTKKMIEEFNSTDKGVDLLSGNSEIFDLMKKYQNDSDSEITESIANFGTNFDNPAEEADISVEELLRQSGIQLDPDLKKIMEGYNI